MKISYKKLTYYPYTCLFDFAKKVLFIITLPQTILRITVITSKCLILSWSHRMETFADYLIIIYYLIDFRRLDILGVSNKKQYNRCDYNLGCAGIEIR